MLTLRCLCLSDRTVSVESDVSPHQLQPVSAKLEIRVFDKSESRRSEAGAPPPPTVPTIAVVTPAAPAPAPAPAATAAAAAPVSSASSAAAAPQSNQVRCSPVRGNSLWCISQSCELLVATSILCIINMPRQCLQMLSSNATYRFKG